MKITESELDHLARLAKLKLNNEEKKAYKKQLGEIFDYIEKLSKIKTNSVKAISVKTRNRFRSDESQLVAGETKKAIISQFTNQENNLLKTKSPLSKNNGR